VLIGGQASDGPGEAAQEQAPSENQTYEVQDGGNDVLPWVVGIGIPLLVAAIVGAVVVGLRSGRR
jgi:hypothetical protein